ncbi:hypothetical protein ACFQNF_20315 [Iodobacter arcticus]|uniref:Uncharacterized protein n=1 Tax=Iodobacter arcticus TaxID=590593 RepID=A0ABW2R2R7_9NEIS
MEPIKLNTNNGTMHIEDFPDTVRVIKLTGEKSKRLSHLSLHKMDLFFAESCFNAVTHPYENSGLIQESLWRSAIIFYIKCFGNSKSRGPLSAGRIFKNNPLALKTHKEFKYLRDKHLVHDENSFSQSHTGAILACKDKPYKIEKIISTSIGAITLNDGSYNNLKLLINHTMNWVSTEYDNICNDLTTELEKESHESLLTYQEINIKAPSIDEVSHPRVDNH